LNPELDELNSPQREAVEHLDGPLLILAGAGSGKTRVITNRIANLIDNCGVSPWQILAVTFTNKAAQEMRERVERLVGHSAKSISLGTFHSICVRILRRYIDRLGYETSFSIYDSDDQLRLVRQILKDLNISKDRFKPNAILGAIGQFKQEMLGPDEVSLDQQHLFQEVALRVYEAYQAKLKASNALDFDDLLNMAVKLLQKDEEVRSILSDQWKFILVDEYQDTNRAQYSMLRLLTESHQNICVVGDDDQSIYRWRGADIQNILSFEKDYQNSRVVKLEQNYRSTGNILNIAYDVICKNEERKEKKLWTALGEGERAIVYAAETESREGQYIADQISRLSRSEGYSHGKFAVFYRTNAQSRAIEQQLVMNRIPYTIVGGLRFYERKEIKDTLAYLRVLSNIRDEINLLRIINVPARGIGAVTVGKLRNIAATEGTTVFNAMQLACEKNLLSAGPLKKITGFVKLMNELQSLVKTVPLDEFIPELLEKVGYWDMLNREDTDESKDRIANLNELVNEVSEYVTMAGEEASLEAFLERTALVADIDSFDNDNEKVALMTVHSAKGLEFPIVFLTGMEEQLFPHSRSMDSEFAIEEERRLAYVGITRARKKLFLTLARTRMVFGQTRATTPSRFMNDISVEYIEDRSFVLSKQKATDSLHFGRNNENENEFSQLSEDGFEAPDMSIGEMDYEPSFDADTGEPTSAIQPGVKVYHPSWGVGKVVAVIGNGESAKVKVMFPSIPLKQIIAKYLQPVG